MDLKFAAGLVNYLRSGAFFLSLYSSIWSVAAWGQLLKSPLADKLQPLGAKSITGLWGWQLLAPWIFFPALATNNKYK
jgi:hypothetical protein